ncbi:MAG: hypothetical protein IT384_32090 [Deltaproteobacteria bacterium]|nr:hypothetical protein [Deltaproteobacteria bacterium]
MLLALGAFACKRPPLAPARIDVEDSAQCEACHTDIAREWQESMHARAGRGDPIYEAILAVRAKKEGADLATKCAPCHQPRPARENATLAGVSCAACHATQSVGTEGHGAQRLLAAPPSTLLGPHDVKPGVSPAHETGPRSAHLADGSTLCLACHGSLENAQKISLCATGVEWQTGTATGAPPSCTLCHMPRVAGLPTAGSTRADHAEHRFLGPARARHFADRRRPGDAVHIRVTRSEHEVSAVLTNVAGHAFPTGFPGRVAEVAIRGLDARGQAVWTSTSGLMKVYLDASGNPVMAPYGVTLARDTRLKAGETRAYSLPLLPGTERVEVEVSTRLMAPRLAKMVGLDASPLIAPQTISKSADK